MRPVALRWLSARTLQAVQHTAHEAACGWARAWGLDEPGEPSVEAVSSWPAVGASDLDLAEDSPPGASWTAALGHALFRGDTVGSTMAPAVVADATGQLRAALRRALGTEVSHQEGDAEAMAGVAPGHVGAVVQLDILHHTWRTHAPHVALARQGLLRLPKPGAVPRWTAEQALATTPVPLQAVLGHVQVDVLDVLNLTHGDVLLLPQRGLDTAVQVQGVGTPLQLSARLGASARHRAVQWQAPTSSH
jgi:flagellar motor switch/type III secretory pathway protein FliN